MSQVVSAGFQGSDTDELDKIVAKLKQIAQYTDLTIKALQLLVKALRAMSWTGYAAALAAYLEGAVIPPLQVLSKNLKMFAQIVGMASSLQKSTSSNKPVVHTGDAGFVPARVPNNAVAAGAPAGGAQVSVAKPGAIGAVQQTPTPDLLKTIAADVAAIKSSLDKFTQGSGQGGANGGGQSGANGSGAPAATAKDKLQSVIGQLEQILASMNGQEAGTGAGGASGSGSGGSPSTSGGSDSGSGGASGSGSGGSPSTGGGSDSGSGGSPSTNGGSPSSGGGSGSGAGSTGTSGSDTGSGSSGTGTAGTGSSGSGGQQTGGVKPAFEPVRLYNEIADVLRELGIDVPKIDDPSAIPGSGSGSTGTGTGTGSSGSGLPGGRTIAGDVDAVQSALDTLRSDLGLSTPTSSGADYGVYSPAATTTDAGVASGGATPSTYEPSSSVGNGSPPDHLRFR